MKLTQLEQELQRARQQVLSMCSYHNLHTNMQFMLKSFIYFPIYWIIFGLLKGIFISSSGEQSQSIGGNGMIILFCLFDYVSHKRRIFSPKLVGKCFWYQTGIRVCLCFGEEQSAFHVTCFFKKICCMPI